MSDDLEKELEALLTIGWLRDDARATAAIERAVAALRQQGRDTELLDFADSQGEREYNIESENDMRVWTFWNGNPARTLRETIDEELTAISEAMRKEAP